MGWFGISNTVNRCNNACSMRADAQLVKTLQEKTKELSAALDAQLIHAGKLVYVANAAPPTQMLCSRHGDLSATAGELAADLSIAKEDAQQCRNAVGKLAGKIDETRNLLKSVVQQYNLPRVKRLFRLDEKGQPATGKQIADFTKGLAQQVLSSAQHFEATHAHRAVNTHNIIAKAEMIMLNQISDSNRVVNVLRQLTSP